jgi:phytoene dehydrogenase-like protein
MQADSYDTIIIGAGHNGLVCAAYLARQGQRTLVLEAADNPGGLAVTREFHPGFKASIAHTVSQFSAKITADLSLAKHGYSGGGEPLANIGLNPRGDHVILKGGTASGVSPGDADSYSQYTQQLQKFAAALAPFWMKTMPRIGNNSLSELMTFAQLGLKLRLLGKDDMREFLRIAALPARDLMDENFDSEILKATLSWDGLIGSKMAPRSPNSTVLAMLYRMCGEHHGAHCIPANGVDGLIAALLAAATAAGAEVCTGQEVERIQIDGSEDGLSASGVILSSGEKISARRVVSAADPQRTFLKLVGVENLEIEFSNRIRRLRCDGYVAKLHLALRELPQFTGLERPDGRMIIAENMDTIEFAFDDAKYGECSSEPVLEMVIPSLHDSSMAPANQQVLSAHVMYVPYQLKGGWTEQARSTIYERSVDAIARYAPGIRECIIHGELLTPADLEQHCGVTGGHWHHTELSLDQMLMMRPTFEAAQYSTPIPGLFLCGAGCHPGGGIMGGAGHNAAREILR